MSTTRTPCRIFVATLALVAALAGSANAAVLDGDLVGGVRVGERPALRDTAPDLYVPAGVLTTIDGRELWARDPEARRAMASTTKIMTAVVVLENARLDDPVTVGSTALRIGESGMNLRKGEVLTVEQLLEGLLIQSGNDAATTLAEHVGGSIDGFVAMMNAKAAALDLANTRYRNAHGLDVAGHYTSAEDLTALSRYAMGKPLFRKLVGRYTGKVVTDHYTHRLQSHNVLLKTYRGAEGIKTGWTDEAGYCVVVAARRDGVELVGTIMGAASEAGRAQQAKKLFDWGFAHYRPTRLVTAGEPAGRVRVSDYLERTVGARTAEATTVPVFDLAGPIRRRIDLKPSVPAPVTKGDPIGTMTIYQGDALLLQVPLVASADVPEPTVWQRIVFFVVRTWRAVFGG